MHANTHTIIITYNSYIGLYNIYTIFVLTEYCTNLIVQFTNSLHCICSLWIWTNRHIINQVYHLENYKMPKLMSNRLEHRKNNCVLIHVLFIRSTDLYMLKIYTICTATSLRILLPELIFISSTVQWNHYLFFLFFFTFVTLTFLNTSCLMWILKQKRNTFIWENSFWSSFLMNIRNLINLTYALFIHNYLLVLVGGKKLLLYSQMQHIFP